VPIRYLTRRTSNAELSTDEVRYHITIPEYPESSQNGIIHIIDVTGRSKAQVESMHEDVSDHSSTGFRPLANRLQIQYGKRKLNHRPVKSNLLNDALVKLTRFQCSGVKVCPHLHPQLRDFSNYTKVDDAWFAALVASRQEPVVDPSLRAKESVLFRLTEGLFLTLQKNFYELNPCRPAGRCSGRPALRSSTNLVRT
jgi:hypothetical protein